MLSLIDKETQYFVAESTKTLDLGGSGESELEGDGCWLELGVRTSIYLFQEGI